MSYSDQVFQVAAERIAQSSEHPVIARVTKDGMSRVQYQAFLFDLFHVVKHFCPAMQAAIPLCQPKFPDVAAALEHSISEEMGHEKWVLHDITAMGFDADAAVQNVPSPHAQASIAFNYYAAANSNPCAILGMLTALELIAAKSGGGMAAATRKRLGVTQKAGFGFLESHGELDQGHGDDMRKLLHHVTDRDAQQAIINATLVNIELFAGVVLNAYRAGAPLQTSPLKRAILGWLIR